MKAGMQLRTPGVRHHNVTLAIGKPGTGKSTMCADFVKDYMRLNREKFAEKGISPRAFIHDPSDSGSLAHIPTCRSLVEKYKLVVDDPIDVISLKCSDGSYWWKEGALRYLGQSVAEEQRCYETLCRHFQNGMVWFDEATNYYRTKPKEYQRLPFYNRRNYGWELFLSFHTLRSVPLEFASSSTVTKYILLPTGEGNISEKQFQRFSPVWMLMQSAYQHLRKLSETAYRVQPHYFIDVNAKTKKFFKTIEG